MATLAICIPFRYTLYPVTPTLSVDAVHDKFICDDEITVAESPVGMLGAVVSEGGGVVVPQPVLVILMLAIFILPL